MRTIIDATTGVITVEPDFIAPSFPTAQPIRDISMVWFRIALAELGHLQAVDAAVAQLGEAEQLLWEYGFSIREDDKDAMAIASALGIGLGVVFDKAEEIRSARAKAQTEAGA